MVNRPGRTTVIEAGRVTNAGLRRGRPIGRWNGHEAHGIASLEQRGRPALLIEHAPRRSPDEPPSSRADRTVHAGLASGNPHAALGNGLARRRVPGHGDRLVNRAQVREPGQEPEHEDAVGDRRVASDHLLRGTSGELGDLCEVRAVWSAVAHRNLPGRATRDVGGLPRRTGVPRVGYDALQCADVESQGVDVTPTLV